MPKFPDQKTVKVILPSTKDSEDPAYVVIKETLTVGDLMDLKGDEGSLKIGIKMLESLIVEWNFTDKDGKPSPITIDNIKRMDIDDIVYLMTKKIKLPKSDIIDNEKKSD